MVAKRPPMKDLWDSADKVLISLLLCLTAFFIFGVCATFIADNTTENNRECVCKYYMKDNH